MLDLFQEENLKVLGLFAVAAFVVFQLFSRLGSALRPRARPTKSWRDDGLTQFELYRKPDISNPAEQIHAVMGASFVKQKLLNQSEHRVFRIIEAMMPQAPHGHRVFAQINLGEILKSKDDSAYRSINSKRVDILVVNAGGWPVLAVEYQGEGHYQGNAAVRDLIKKEALRKAGVPFIEVFAADNEEEIRSKVRKHLGRRTEPSAHVPHLAKVPAT